MNWKRIVRVYATSYASERCEDMSTTIIDIKQAEPGVWRVLFDPPLAGMDEDDEPEMGLIVLTGQRRMRELPRVYQEMVKHEDEDGDALLWAWPLAELAE